MSSASSIEFRGADWALRMPFAIMRRRSKFLQAMFAEGEDPNEPIDLSANRWSKELFDKCLTFIIRFDVWLQYGLEAKVPRHPMLTFDPPSPDIEELLSFLHVDTGVVTLFNLVSTVNYGADELEVLINNAAEFVSMDMLVRFVIAYKFNLEHEFDKAIIRGNIRTMDWLNLLRPHCPFRIDVAIYLDDINVILKVDSVRWLWANCESDFRECDLTEVFCRVAEVRNLELLKFLWNLHLEHDLPLDPAAHDNFAFRAAGSGARDDMVEWLWSLRTDHGAPIDPTVDNSVALYRALTTKNTRLIRMLTTFKIDGRLAVDFTWRNNFAFRHMAASGYLPILELLWDLRVREGVLIDPTAGDQHPLCSAASNKHWHVVEWLCKELRDNQGVAIDVDVRDGFVRTLARMEGHEDVL